MKPIKLVILKNIFCLYGKYLTESMNILSPSLSIKNRRINQLFIQLAVEFAPTGFLVWILPIRVPYIRVSCWFFFFPTEEV